MGNGQHLAQCGSVFAYIMAFSVRRDTVLELYPATPGSLRMGTSLPSTPPRWRHWKRHIPDMQKYEKKQEEKRKRHFQESMDDNVCDTVVSVHDSLEEVEFDYEAEVPGSQGSQKATVHNDDME